MDRGDGLHAGLSVGDRESEAGESSAWHGGGDIYASVVGGSDGGEDMKVVASP